MKRLYIIIGILIAIIFALVGYIIFLKMEFKDNDTQKESTEAVSYLTLSINPDIELALNTNDVVVEVIPINDDADVLTSDLDLVGLKVEDAADALIDSAMETGYLDENSSENTIVVTTVNDDETDREALESKIMTSISTHLELKEIYPVLVAVGLDDELKAEADTYDISYGKMLLIEKATTLDSTLSKDELATMEVKDIQAIIKDYVTERRNQVKATVAELKQEKQELKQTYSEKVQALKDSLAEEHSEELQSMTEAQRTEAMTSYLKEAKEQIKNSIKNVVDEIEEDEETTSGNSTDNGNSSTSNTTSGKYTVVSNGNSDSVKDSIKSKIQASKNN